MECCELALSYWLFILTSVPHLGPKALGSATVVSCLWVSQLWVPTLDPLPYLGVADVVLHPKAQGLPPQSLVSGMWVSQSWVPWLLILSLILMPIV